MNRWEKYLAEHRAFCSGCGKKHYMPVRGTRQTRVRLTKKGWWASDLARRTKRA